MRHPLARALHQPGWTLDERPVGQLQIHVRAVGCDPTHRSLTVRDGSVADNPIATIQSLANH